MKFKTKLWKRSEKSFASTIPHIALLSMDEEKNHEVVWEYNAQIGKWTFELVPKVQENKSNSKKDKKIGKGKTKSESTKTELNKSESNKSGEMNE